MAKLMTIDGSFAELPSAPDGYILCLVKCRMRWLAPDDLLNHHIPPGLNESPGSFPDAAIIATSDGEGNRVAVAVPYDCADKVYVFQVHDGYPEWMPAW
jgi:hypothetical protein